MEGTREVLTKIYYKISSMSDDHMEKKEVKGDEQ